MATRSTIAIENADGTVDQIYGHWDGYLRGVGATLVKHYTDRSKVEQLIAQGAVSILAPEIGTEHPFSRHDAPLDNRLAQEEWDALYENMCTFYARDRGEDLHVSKFKDIADYEANHEFQEFEYLFTADDVWSVFYNDEWADLEYELQQLDSLETTA